MKQIPESGSIVHVNGRDGLRFPSSPSSGCIVSSVGNNWTVHVVPGVIARHPNDRQAIAILAKIFNFIMAHDVGYGGKYIEKHLILKNICAIFCAKIENRTKIAQKSHKMQAAVEIYSGMHVYNDSIIMSNPLAPAFSPRISLQSLALREDIVPFVLPDRTVISVGENPSFIIRHRR